jgi:hypothetical protein
MARMERMRLTDEAIEMIAARFRCDSLSISRVAGN